jgi:ribosome-binding factor A
MVRRVASQTVLFELNDPRIKDVTVTRAEVSPDLQQAKVYVSLMGSEAAQQDCLKALQRASGVVQKALGEHLKTRYTPAVEFVIDKGIKNSLEVTRLLNEAMVGRSAAEAADLAEGSAAEEDDADAPASS